jgi:hypothetical protein
MDMNDCCPLIEDCSVYQNKVNHNEMVGLTYRSLYCLQVNKKYKVCKRYNVYIKIGKAAPRDVLPNSPVSVDELADSIGSR